MKTNMKTILCLLFFLTSLVAYGGTVDVLDPEYQKQIEEYETLLREWKESGGDYEVSVKEVHNLSLGKVAESYPEQYFYEITLPKKVSNYVSCKKSFFLGEMLGRYFENDDFSFLSMVMFTAKKRNGGIRWFRCPIVPISEKNRTYGKFQKNLIFH